MKTLIRTILVLSFLTILSTAAFGQRTRINFAPGAKSTVASGTLSGYKSSKTFVIRVRKGQKLTTEQVGKNAITVEITAPRGSTYEPDMAADCHNRHEVSPTAAGDYVIKVTECMKADRWRSTFRLRVQVR